MYANVCPEVSLKLPRTRRSPDLRQRRHPSLHEQDPDLAPLHRVGRLVLVRLEPPTRTRPEQAVASMI